MFKHQLTANGRQIARARYQMLIIKGCSPSQARNAAEVLTLEDENLDYHRTVYDQQAINNCWEKLTSNNE